MKNSLLIAIFAVLAGASPAIAGHCGKSAQSDGSKLISRETTSTAKTHFRWSADTYPFSSSGDLQESLHTIENLHDWRLAFDWKDVGFQRFFRDPLPSRGDDCTADQARQFHRKTDSTVETTNDGGKNVVAYVPATDVTDQNEGESDVDGATTRSTGAQVILGDEQARAGIMLTYHRADRHLTVWISSGPGGYSIAFQPAGIGVNLDEMAKQIDEVGGKVSRTVSIGTLGETLEGAEREGSVLTLATDEPFVQVSLTEPATMNFSGVEDVPAEAAPLLIFSPDGILRYAKRLSMATFGAN